VTTAATPAETAERIWKWRANHGKRGARAYNGVLGAGQSPQRGPGAEPLVRKSEGRSPPPLKLKRF